MLGDGKADTIGQKKNFVADGHTVLFTSNGQVHHHWTPVDFRERTKLRQLSEHLLVVVETDPLPIAVRTDFFTADRSGVRASEEALRLESELAGFLDGWDELRELNAELIRESIMSAGSERPDVRDFEADQPCLCCAAAGLQVPGERTQRDTSSTSRAIATLKPPPRAALRPDLPQRPGRVTRPRREVEGAAVRDRREGRVLRERPRQPDDHVLAPGHRR